MAEQNNAHYGQEADRPLLDPESLTRAFRGEVGRDSNLVQRESGLEAACIEHGVGAHDTGCIAEGQWARMVFEAQTRNAHASGVKMFAVHRLAPYALAACIGGLVSAGAMFLGMQPEIPETRLLSGLTQAPAVHEAPVSSYPAIPSDRQTFVRIDDRNGFLAHAGAQVRLHSLTDSAAVVLLRSGTIEAAQTAAPPRSMTVLTPQGLIELRDGAMRIMVNDFASEVTVYEGQVSVSGKQSPEQERRYIAGRTVLLTADHQYVTEAGDSEAHRWRTVSMNRYIQWLQKQSKKKENDAESGSRIQAG